MGLAALSIPMPDPFQPPIPSPVPPPSSFKLKAFLTGMILAGSALVGGLAVVLWHRKTLSGLRQPAGAGKKLPASEDAHEE